MFNNSSIYIYFFKKNFECAIILERTRKEGLPYYNELLNLVGIKVIKIERIRSISKVCRHIGRTKIPMFPTRTVKVKNWWSIFTF